MHRASRRVATGAAFVVLASTATGTVVAATRASDEVALAPVRATASQNVERRINELMAKMTVEEKLQQVTLLSNGQVTDADAKAGVGGVFSLTDPVQINHLQ